MVGCGCRHVVRELARRYVMTSRTRSTNKGDGMALSTAQLAPTQVHRIFVYGTLKQGQPNHPYFLDPTSGKMTFLGRCQTLQPFPLLIATRHHMPFFLWKPNYGKIIQGELYEVDDEMLDFLDDFEGHPGIYTRTRLSVERTNAIVERDKSEQTTSKFTTDSHSGAKNNSCDSTTFETLGHGKADGHAENISHGHLDGSPVQERDTFDLEERGDSVIADAELPTKPTTDHSATCDNGSIVDCWVYAMTRFPEGLLKKSLISNYNVRDNPQRIYYEEDDDDFEPAKIQRELERECE